MASRCPRAWDAGLGLQCTKYWVSVSGLSAPGSKSGVLQRACFERMEVHRDEGTSDGVDVPALRARAARLVTKDNGGVRTDRQNVADALLALRDAGLVGWDKIYRRDPVAHVLAAPSLGA